MLIKKIKTLHRLFQEGGVHNIYDHARFMWRVRTMGHKPEVRLSKCTFNLDQIADYPTRVELIMDKYEAPERQAVARYIRRNLPVIEFGGSMGIVACVTNRLLKNPAAHVVVEANPLVIPQLERNRTLNNCRFEVVQKAIAYGQDSVTFYPSSNICISSVAEKGDQPPVSVKTITLDRLIRDYEFGRFNFVCDIEGMEYELVMHEPDALQQADTLILETHARFIGEERNRAMMAKLQEIGFNVVKEIGVVAVLRKDR
jgi:FkbM family methyltransferase